MYLNPVHITTFHLLKIHFRVILPPILKPCKWALPFTFPDSDLEWISHVCHMHYVSIPLATHLDNAEFVSWSHTIKHAHTVHHLLQLMLCHSVNLVSRKNLRVDCIESYHRSWNTNTNIMQFYVAPAEMLICMGCHCLYLPISIYSGSNNIPIKIY